MVLLPGQCLACLTQDSNILNVDEAVSQRIGKRTQFPGSLVEDFKMIATGRHEFLQGLNAHVYERNSPFHGLNPGGGYD